jgi:hypothetical protein
MVLDFDLPLLEEALVLFHGQVERLDSEAAVAGDPEQFGVWDRLDHVLAQAFIACQLYIVAQCSTASVSRREALHSGPRHGCGLSVALILNAAANYCKHRDEGPAASPALREETLNVLQTLGAELNEYAASNILAELVPKPQASLLALLPMLVQWREALGSQSAAAATPDLHQRALETYFGFFTVHLTALDAYLTDNSWTPWATSALVRVGESMHSGYVAARGHQRKNDWRRSEYLTLDVVIGNRDTWGAPLFVAEHENSKYAWKVRYCAWKLLSTYARHRVLVAYWGVGSHFRTFEDLTTAVAEVAEAHRGKPLVLIGGDYAAIPKSLEDFRRAHRSILVCG